MADAFTRLFAPNVNYGMVDSLTVRSFTGSANRYSVYVRFDQTAIETQVGGGQLDSARLEFSLRDGGSWPASGDWLNVYRIPNSWAPGGWTETGITANCPHDTNTSNSGLNCPGGVWDTTGFGTMTPTDQVLLNNDTRGWISFDVTADIAGFLADTLNHGWYVAKQNNNNNQRIVFWSRESAQKPRLVLYVSHESSSSTLSAFLDPGVTGTPGNTDVTHQPETTVNYSYSLEPGYEGLTVTLDGQIVPASGTVTMTQSHLLVAYARRSAQLSSGGEAVRQSLLTVLASPTHTNYQQHLDEVMDLADALGPDQAGLQAELAYDVAIDPIADSVALQQMDDALANHVFYVKPAASLAPGSEADTLDRMVYLYVNGIATPSYRAQSGAMITLRNMIQNRPHFRVEVDTIGLVYNRTRLETFPSPQALAMKCINRLRLFPGLLPTGEVWKDAYDTCMGNQNPGPATTPDVMEAVLQFMGVAGLAPYMPDDAHSLASEIQGFRDRGGHVLVLAHSQGSLMLHQASNEIYDNEQLSIQDSVGLAAITMASPTISGFPPPLDEHHLKHVVAPGDLIPRAGVMGPLGWEPSNPTTPTPTPLADTAALELERVANLGPVGQVFAAFKAAWWGIFVGHSVDLAYLGQAPIRNKVSAWVDTLRGKLAVGAINAGPEVGLNVDDNYDAHASFTVLNHNGRQLYNRRLTWTSTNPSVATITAWGFIDPNTQGTALIIGSRGNIADTLSVRVFPPLEDMMTVITSSIAWYTAFSPDGIASHGYQGAGAAGNGQVGFTFGGIWNLDLTVSTDGNTLSGTYRRTDTDEEMQVTLPRQ